MSPDLRGLRPAFGSLRGVRPDLRDGHPPSWPTPQGERTVQFRLLFRHRGIMATASAAAAVAIAGGVIAAATPPKAHETMASTANSQQGTGGTGGQPASQGNPAAAPRPSAPLQVLSVTPADGGKDANGAAPVKITFNEAVAASTPM